METPESPESRESESAEPSAQAAASLSRNPSPDELRACCCEPLYACCDSLCTCCPPCCDPLCPCCPPCCRPCCQSCYTFMKWSGGKCAWLVVFLVITSAAVLYLNHVLFTDSAYILIAFLAADLFAMIMIVNILFAFCCKNRVTVPMEIANAASPGSVQPAGFPHTGGDGTSDDVSSPSLDTGNLYMGPSGSGGGTGDAGGTGGPNYPGIDAVASSPSCTSGRASVETPTESSHPSTSTGSGTGIRKPSERWKTKMSDSPLPTSKLAVDI